MTVAQTGSLIVCSYFVSPLHYFALRRVRPWRTRWVGLFFGEDVVKKAAQPQFAGKLI